MKRFPLLLALAGLVFAGCATATREPRNLSTLKAELIAYVESGEYDRQLAAAAAPAQAWIEQRAARRAPGGKLTVVFDLDETLLLNFPHIRRQDFGYTSAVWSAWVNEAAAAPIVPVREVYRTARRLGVDVVYITGRRERDRAGTERNLRAIDCADHVSLICKPDADSRTSGVFKTEARQRLAAGGRVIIANIGDQESDLAGGYAERTFKLPNPFYISE